MSMPTPPLRLLLIDPDTERAERLTQSLHDGGHAVVAHSLGSRTLLADVVQHAVQLVILVTRATDEELLERLAALQRVAARPVVLFSADDRPSVVERAIHAGACAYIVAPPDTCRLASAITVASARFHQLQQLREELMQTRASLQERKVIERAKGLLMVRQNLDEEAAYQTLRRMAMDRGQRLGDVARTLIKALQLSA